MNTRNSLIGFIGLGAMRSRMAKRLIDAGFKVVVFDRNRDKIETLSALGAAKASSVRAPDGFYAPVPAKQRRFPTATGKANFTINPIRPNSTRV